MRRDAARPAPARESPSISVIVPTRDRPLALSRCLDALSAQTVVDHLEIVVVDDGSIARDEVTDVVARHPRAQLIRRRGEGPAAARNAGAAAAAGAFLCFTDDDCEPDPEWVEQLVRRLRQGADAVAGVTLSSGGAIAAASEITAHAPAAVPAPAGSNLSFAPSNNVACTRATFEATPFDETYPSAAAEDREWCARLLGAGRRLCAEPRARIVHHQQLTLVDFLRQQARYGRGAFQFRLHSSEHRPLESPAFYKGLLQQAFTECFSVGVLVAIAQVATLLGFVSGWLTGKLKRRAQRPKAPLNLPTR